jgi:hypothetical protein
MAKLEGSFYRASSAIAVPASVAAGAAIDVGGFPSCAVQIVGSFTATYDVQASLDGSNFVTVATITAAAIVSVPLPAVAVRINCTAYTSGTPTGVVVSAR